MDRILQNTAATITVDFEQDGVLTDPDNGATVQIVRSDGTVVVATTAATPISTGVFGFTLSSAQTALLDKLTATWTASFNSVVDTFTTEVEVAGGFLVTLATLRADPDLANTTTFPTAKLIEGRQYAEEEIEQAAGLAFVPRYRSQTLRGSGIRELMLDRAAVRSIRNITVDGTALSSTELATLTLTGSTVWRPNLWPIRSTLVVGYEYGLDQPPTAIRRAALIVAKQYIVGRVMDDRSIQRATPDGPVYIATPGWQGKRFGIPEVDAAIDAYADTVDVG